MGFFFLCAVRPSQVPRTIAMVVALSALACGGGKDAAPPQDSKEAQERLAFVTDSETVAQFVATYGAAPLGDVAELTFAVDWQRQMAGRSFVMAGRVNDVLKRKEMTAILSSPNEVFLFVDSTLAKQLNMNVEWLGSFRLRDPALIEVLRTLANSSNITGPMGIFAIRIDSVSVQFIDVQRDSGEWQPSSQGQRSRVLYGELLAVRRMESGFDAYFFPTKQ